MKKEVPMKNYFILALIFLITVIGVFYAREWYNTSKEYYAQNSVMTKLVREIKSEEIANYTLENQKFVLYVASGKNFELKDFEDEFKNLIKNMDLIDSVVYMNLVGVDPNSFYNLLKNDFSATTRIKDQITNDSSASLYVFTDGKITNILNNVNDYSMKRLESIITRWEIK